MPPYYDIYGLSRQREKETIEKFLTYFSIRERIENREGQVISVFKNEKYKTEETYIAIRTLTEVIDFGLENRYVGFAFYIGDNLKEGIGHIILKFTFDGKIIFGISIEENIIDDRGKLIDNYDEALKVGRAIEELTNATKTFIKVEYAPSDDEDGFDRDIEVWRKLHEEKQRK